MVEGREAKRRRTLGIVGFSAAVCLFAVIVPKTFPFARAADPGQPIVPDLPPAADFAVVLLSVVCLVSALLLRTVVTGVDRENLQQRKPVWMQLVIFGLVLLGIAAFTQVVRDRTDEGGVLPKPAASSSAEAAGGGGESESSRALGWVLTGLMVAITVAVGGGTAWLIGKTKGAASGDELDPLLAEIDESYVRISADADAREAVIACYMGMTSALERAGAIRRASDTPFEFLERSLTNISVSKTNAEHLTELFERARFSLHETDDAMRTEALAALDSVREDLARQVELEDAT